MTGRTTPVERPRAVSRNTRSTSSNKRNNLSYVCDKHRMHGRSACRGIGYRAEHAVDAALLRAVAPFIDGDVAERAVRLLKDHLEAQAKDHGRESARERVRRDLEAAQRKARNLAGAIARGGEMDALLAALREETGRIDGLRAELARLEHAAPVAIDSQRILATARSHGAKTPRRVLDAIAARGRRGPARRRRSPRRPAPRRHAHRGQRLAPLAARRPNLGGIPDVPRRQGSFCTLPIVCRAARVDVRFTTAAALVAAVAGVGTFLGWSPKSDDVDHIEDRDLEVPQASVELDQRFHERPSVLPRNPPAGAP
jgi:hypothetical protein